MKIDKQYRFTQINRSLDWVFCLKNYLIFKNILNILMRKAQLPLGRTRRKASS